MDVQLISMSPIRIAMIRHVGPYEDLGPKFDDLWAWVEQHGVDAQRTIGIYWDNPDFVPARRLRSAACVEVPPGTSVPFGGGVPIEIGEIAGGTYATTTFVGPYEDLAPIWAGFTRQIEGPLRRTISQQNPAFEVYVNDASCTPPAQLITELYMPVL